MDSYTMQNPEQLDLEFGAPFELEIQIPVTTPTGSTDDQSDV